jgi:hypothetical protein
MLVCSKAVLLRHVCIAGDSDSSVGKHSSSREGSFGRNHRRVPMTELQSGMPPSALRGGSSRGDGERVHGGKAAKSVAFSDSAREPSPLGDVAEG